MFNLLFPFSFGVKPPPITTYIFQGFSRFKEMKLFKTIINRIQDLRQARQFISEFRNYLHFTLIQDKVK